MEIWKNVTSENFPLFFLTLRSFDLQNGKKIKLKQTQRKHGTSDIAACHSPNMLCTTSLRRHHCLWCIIMTVYVWERYLKRRKDETGLFSVKREKKETQAQMEQKKRPECLFASQKPLFLFWQTLNTNRLHQCHTFNLVSQVQNNRRDSDDVSPYPGSHGHVEAVHLMPLISPLPGLADNDKMVWCSKSKMGIKRLLTNWSATCAGISS